MKYYEILCNGDKVLRNTLSEATDTAREMADAANHPAIITELTSRHVAEIQPEDES